MAAAERHGGRAGAAAARANQAAGRLYHRAGRTRAWCARDDVRDARHAVRRIDAGQHVCVVLSVRRQRSPDGTRRGFGLAPAERHRVSRGRALRRRGDARPALRRHRVESRASAAAGRGHGRGRRAWAQVHRVRSGRQALRPHRRPVQHLRIGPRPLCRHHACQCRRIRLRGGRAGPAQLRRVRLGPAQPRAVGDEQRRRTR